MSNDKEVNEVTGDPVGVPPTNTTFNQYESQIHVDPETIYREDTGLFTMHTKVNNPKGELVSGHCYLVGTHSDLLCEVMFQNGPIPAHGVNGVTTESLLAALIHRTEVLDAQFPCDENKRGIESMKDALQAFQERTANRRKRGVEGQAVV